jgi:hypothetical protein
MQRKKIYSAWILAGDNLLKKSVSIKVSKELNTLISIYKKSGVEINIETPEEELYKLIPKSKAIIEFLNDSSHEIDSGIWSKWLSNIRKKKEKISATNIPISLIQLESLARLEALQLSESEWFKKRGGVDKAIEGIIKHIKNLENKVEELAFELDCSQIDPKGSMSGLEKSSIDVFSLMIGALNREQKSLMLDDLLISESVNTQKNIESLLEGVKIKNRKKLPKKIIINKIEDDFDFE